MSLALLLLVLAAPSANPLDAGVTYQLDGRITKSKDENGDGEKRFRIRLFSDTGDEQRPTVYWTLREDGRGEAPWLERFGGCSPFAVADGPALYYRRDEGLSIASLPPLALEAESPLADGVTWSRAARVFEVVGETTVDEQPCWKVESRDAVGRIRDMVVEKRSGLVVRLKQVMFLGQGERYELEWSVKRAGKSPAIASAADVVRQLISLRDASGWRRQSESSELTEKQRESIAKALKPLLDKAAGSPLEGVLTAARLDLASQTEKAATVEQIAKKALGKSLLGAKLNNVAGEPIDVCNGRVTVLHFWKYRDKPLKDPYGQSAYVDFLARNRDPELVDVYGVNVDTRLASKGTRSASVRSAKRFGEFMNLSYPLLMDEGELIRRIGDPRQAGAQLPLFVVLDPNGKVVVFKSGFYEVDRREGLKELSEAVRAAAIVK